MKEKKKFKKVIAILIPDLVTPLNSYHHIIIHHTY